jgi:AcrR family transcriptional regulator
MAASTGTPDPPPRPPARRRSSAAATSPRLGPDDWTAAALDAVAEGGVANVSVERLAAGLGATKGSFYWHFKDRPALIAAMLERWEQHYTDRVMEALAAIEDPVERFRTLLESGFADSTGARVDVNLLADAADPVVAEALERVAVRRLAFVDQIFAQLELEDGSDRALLAFSAYLGIAQLRRTAPRTIPKGRRMRAFVDSAVRSLTEP